MLNSRRPSGRCAAWRSTDSPARRPASSAARRLHRRPRSACTADPPRRHPVQSRPIRASRDNRGLRLLSFSSSRFNWLSTITGTFNSFASALMPLEMSAISCCRFSCDRRAVECSKLQIVNDEKLDAVLLAMRRARARNCKIESPAVSSMNSGAFASRPAALVSFGKSASLMNPSRMLRRFTRAMRAHHAQHQRLRAHFQAEHPHRQFLLQRHVLGDVHRQRRFAHRRPRRDDDHFAAMQTVRHPVQIREARGQPVQRRPCG